MAAFAGFKPKKRAKSYDDMTEAEVDRDMRELEEFFGGMG